jgi:hypothetical protein
MRVNMPRGSYRGVFSVSNLNSPKFGRTRIDDAPHENVSSLRELLREKFFWAGEYRAGSARKLHRCL